MTEFDGVPDEPFLTRTVNVPAANTAAPVRRVVVLFNPDTTHDVLVEQPGPIKYTSEFDVLKPLPLIVKLNACPLTGGFGDVVIEEILGTPLFTVKETPVDVSPVELFRTVTVNVPVASTA